jgi:hypothetical protein
MASDIVAYGIYADRLAFERALEALRAAGFRNSDISAILPDRDRTLRPRSTPRHQKGLQRAQVRAQRSAAYSDGLSESARSSFPA